MRYLLPANNLYGETPIPLEFPDSWDVQICGFAGMNTPPLTVEQMIKKISNPTDCGRIAQDARGAKDAVIIFDDISRATPMEDIAKILVTQLEDAGVPRNKIRFMAAVGCHRAMYYEDFVRKLGRDIVHEFPVYNHNPFFNNVFLGHTDFGVPVELNAECVWADYKIGVGMVMPHPSAGMGGGAKLILPGIASLESVRRFHLSAPSRWTVGTPAIENTLQAADMLGLNMKVDALLNGNGQICNLFAGSCRSNVTDHLEELKLFFETPKADPADLVIANNYFKPSEPSIAVISTGLSDLVKKGGDLVVAANSPQGCAPHYCTGVWGDSYIGGPLNSGPYPPPSHIGKYFAFCEYMDKSGKLYFPEGDNVFWVDSWQKIIDEIGNEPRKVTIYPYSEVIYFKEVED